LGLLDTEDVVDPSEYNCLPIDAADTREGLGPHHRRREPEAPI